MDSSAPFKWLDMLEQEFDRNFAFVDVMLDEADFEDSYSVDGGTLGQIRQRLSYISGAFGQLVHKSLTIFQSNLKLEARILVAEEDAARTEARCKTLADEVRSLKAQLAAVSSQNPQKSPSLLVEQAVLNPQVVKLLEEDAQHRMLAAFRAQLAVCQYARLKQENEELKREALQSHSEMEALRLTLRYLDKERAGRIQQLQLLGNAKTPVDDRTRVWTQLEAEIALQRCKTVVQTCLARQQRSRKDSQRPENTSGNRNEPIVGEIRTIKYEKPPENAALGLSIVGGRDVALPVIVSSVSPLSPLAGQVVVGDLVKMANGLDLSTASRQEAVEAILSPSGKGPEDRLELQVCYLGGAEDGIHDDELVGNHSLTSANNDNSHPKDPSDQQFETVWLQEGELWPALPSGISVSGQETAPVQQYSFQTRVTLPPILLDPNTPEVVINEKVLQTSLFSSSALLSNAAFNASSRLAVGSGAVVTLKTGIQPREDDVVDDFGISLTNFSEKTDLPGNHNNDNGNDGDSTETQKLDFAASTLSDIAFSADV